jgi:hypothetical protein
MVKVNEYLVDGLHIMHVNTGSDNIFPVRVYCYKLYKDALSQKRYLSSHLKYL